MEMVDLLEEFKSSRSVIGKIFPNYEMLDAKIASALNKTIQNSHFEEVSLEEQKAQKQDRLLRGRQIAFMIYDYFRVSTTFRNSIRDGMKFHYLCQRFFPKISRKVCTN